MCSEINKTWSGFYNDIEETKPILQKNLFPPELIDKAVKNYLSNRYNSKETLNKKEGCCFLLSYVGFFSRHAHSKIKRNHYKQFYEDEVSVNLVFIPYRIDSMFSTKDKIPDFLRSMVAYKFVCG